MMRLCVCACLHTRRHTVKHSNECGHTQYGLYQALPILRFGGMLCETSLHKLGALASRTHAHDVPQTLTGRQMDRQTLTQIDQRPRSSQTMWQAGTSHCQRRTYLAHQRIWECFPHLGMLVVGRVSAKTQRHEGSARTLAMRGIAPALPPQVSAFMYPACVCLCMVVCVIDAIPGLCALLTFVAHVVERRVPLV